MTYLMTALSANEKWCHLPVIAEILSKNSHSAGIYHLHLTGLLV